MTRKLFPESIIRRVSVSVMTWFIRYMYIHVYILLKFTVPLINQGSRPSDTGNLSRFWFTCLRHLVYLLPKTCTLFGFTSVDYACTRWRLLHKFAISVLIIVTTKLLNVKNCVERNNFQLYLLCLEQHFKEEFCKLVFDSKRKQTAIWINSVTKLQCSVTWNSIEVEELHRWMTSA